MEIFNLVNNRLKEKGFKRMELKEIEELGAQTYKSTIIHVVVTKIQVDEQVRNLKSYSNKVRNILLNRAININNTYLLFCYENHIDYETFFMIERDTQGLRKYVIRDYMDLNRIPFLDNLEEFSKGLTEVKTEPDEDYYLSYIHDLLEKKNGNNEKLKKPEIEEAFKLILDLVEGRNENK